MANEDSAKASTNLKVPPLKIVLSSHQNNAVVNKCSQGDEEHPRSIEHKIDSSIEHYSTKDSNRRGSLESKEVSDRQSNKRAQKAASSTSRGESSVNKFTDLSNSSSSSSSSLDRSTSTSPSSESESLASNSTIISEIPLAKPKTDRDETNTLSKPDRPTRYIGRSSTGDRSAANLKDHSSETSTPSGSRDHTLNANQRITRSSQRAAQQVRFENAHDQNGDETNLIENQDKVQESVRKVKRRRNEPQEVEQDPNQVSSMPTVNMANIYPADYQLPSQNSFELYRDIRKRPYKKISKLSHTQPKVPQGFKDYLLNCGPYLLDGNKLGVGHNGSKIENLEREHAMKSSDRVTSNKIKYLNARHRLHKLSSAAQRHSSYNVPKICQPPKSLVINSPLYELFVDQEKSRQQMRMQHLKERERSTLAAEQEILRIYNRAAIADLRQKLHLSACTYFFYQERYHYNNCNSQQTRKTNGVGGEGVNPDVEKSVQTNGELKVDKSTSDREDNSQVPTEANSESKPTDSGSNIDGPTQVVGISKEINENGDNKIDKLERATSSDELSKIMDEKLSDNNQKNDDPNLATPESKGESSVPKPASISDNATKEANVSTKVTDSDSDNSQSELFIGQSNCLNGEAGDGSNLPEEEIFLSQLQEIDDKWDKIRKDMLVRHRNESDSLYAVQTLEWEWKAKEIGACDVRLSLKVGPEFVPRVDILALDY